MFYKFTNIAHRLAKSNSHPKISVAQFSQAALFDCISTTTTHFAHTVRSSRHPVASTRAATVKRRRRVRARACCYRRCHPFSFFTNRLKMVGCAVFCPPRCRQSPPLESAVIPPALPPACCPPKPPAIWAVCPPRCGRAIPAPRDGCCVLCAPGRRSNITQHNVAQCLVRCVDMSVPRTRARSPEPDKLSGWSIVGNADDDK